MLLGDKVFENPKDEEIIQRLVEFCGTKDNDIVLDFFSGSATTAHAVFLANVTQNIKRKIILVQLPELIDPAKASSEKAKKVAENAIKLLDSIGVSHNICEIGKERIRRAGAKIKEENGLAAQNLDIGFRDLKLDSTNMKDVYYNPADFEPSLFDKVTDNIKEDRTPEDLLFQVMLDLGVLLSSKIEETTIDGKRVFNVADGFLIACFDDNVTDETVKAIAQQKPYYAVFRDSSNIVVKCRCGGDVHGAAIDIDASVGVDCVGIAAAHDDCDCAVVDFNYNIIIAAFAGGVDAVVRSINGNCTAVDLNISAFKSLQSTDRKFAAVDLKNRCALNAVIRSGNLEGTTADIDGADGQIIGVLTVQAVFGGVDGEGAAADCDGILGLNAVRCGANGICSACNFQIILGGDTISGSGGNSQTSGAVQNEVILGEDHSICVGSAVRSEGAGDLQRITAAFCSCNEAFVGSFDIDSGKVFVCNTDAVQYELHLCVLCFRVHKDRTVAGGTRYNIDACFRDRDILVVRDCVAGCICRIRCLREIAFGK